MKLDIPDYVDPPGRPVEKLISFRFFMFVFHDSPADVDPLKLRKEVKKSGAYWPPFELLGGLGKNPEHVDPLHFALLGTNPEHVDPPYQFISQYFGSLVEK